MEVKSNNSRELKVLMLLPLRYEPNMLVYPTIEMLGYITHFGHQVTWIISSAKDHQPQPFFREGIKVYTVHYRYYFPGDGILARIVNKIPYAFRRMRFILNILHEEKYDLMLVREDMVDALIAVYVRRRYKVPFVFELPNPLVWKREDLGMETPKPKFLRNLFFRFMGFVWAQLLREADLVLPISKWMKDDLTKNKGIPEAKIMVLPEGANSKSLFHQEREVAREYQLSNSKVIIYEGIMERARHLDVLIRAFSMVREKNQAAKLLMVGEGGDKANLEKLADAIGVREDVIFTGQVPQSEVPDFIAAADIGVSPVPPLPFYKFSSPIKMLEYMAMAKPVVANEEIPDHKDVIEGSGGGILVPFAPEAFAKAIVELLDDSERAAEMGRMGREWVVKNRSYEVLARQVEEAYLRLMVKKGQQ